MELRRASDRHHTYFIQTTRDRYSRLGERKPYYTLAEFRQWLIDALSGEGGFCPCEYCGCRVFIETLQVDHRNPVSRGGDSTLENLAIACKQCNSTKGRLRESAYRELVRLVMTSEAIDNLEKADILHRLEVGDRLAISRQRSLRHPRVRYSKHFEQRAAQ